MRESVGRDRAQFDFEIDFAHGGGVRGQALRLDIEGSDIDDRSREELIVRDLRLLRVADVRILRKSSFPVRAYATLPRT